VAEQRSQERMLRGVVPRPRKPQPILAVDLAATIHRPAKGEAFKLASENRHRPWARRWLKANGYWA